MNSFHCLFRHGQQKKKRETVRPTTGLSSPSSHQLTVFDQDEGLETKTEINHKVAGLNREPIITHLT